MPPPYNKYLMWKQVLSQVLNSSSSSYVDMGSQLFKKLYLFYFILFYFSSNKYGLTFKDKKLKLKLLSPKPKDVNYITQSLTHLLLKLVIATCVSRN